jgi:hypothetical protein
MKGAKRAALFTIAFMSARDRGRKIPFALMFHQIHPIVFNRMAPIAVALKVLQVNQNIPHLLTKSTFPIPVLVVVIVLHYYFPFKKLVRTAPLMPRINLK